MRMGQEVKSKTETAESLRMKGAKNVNGELRASLIDQDSGLLRPGALPQIQGVSSSASKALMGSFGQQVHHCQKIACFGSTPKMDWLLVGCVQM